jgi:hypothetical protein
MSRGQPTNAARSLRRRQWLARPGQLRDSIFIIGGLLYVLGYILWSAHALDEGLGLLPALELQYLLAGSLLAVILLICGLLGVAIRRLVDLGFRWSRDITRPRAVRVAARGMIVVPSLAPVLAGVGLWYAADTDVNSLAFYGAVALFLVLWWLVERVAPRFAKQYDVPFYVATIGATFALGAIPFLIKVVYPKVPQEIGGVKPRCGYVEMSRTDASSSLARELLPSAQGETRIARSRKLSIFFSGGDSYIVRARHLRGAHTYELRKQVVKAVSGC